MPLIQKTVYIREEDLEAWENVPNKAAFLHDALNIGMTTIPAKSKRPDSAIPLRSDLMDPKEFEGPIKTKQDALKAVKPLAPHKNYLKKK